MKFLGMKKVRDGKYLKNYELSYENKAGRLKPTKSSAEKSWKMCRILADGQAVSLLWHSRMGKCSF